MSEDRRPLSPHLQVYDMGQFTSAMSIAHRASGIVMVLGLMGATLWLAMVAAGSSSAAAINAFVTNKLIVLCLFILSGCLFYHLCNGIRHFFWDLGYGFEIEEARRNARYVRIAAVILTVLMWLLISF